jgi:HxlR-like helix-turn-helix
MLATRLKFLADNGIVERRAYQQRPARHEYRLTSAGIDLVPVILALSDWGDRWARPKEGSPILFIHKVCGHQFSPNVVCSEGGTTLTADAVKAVPGPRGAAVAGTRVVARRLRGSKGIDAAR